MTVPVQDFFVGAANLSVRTSGRSRPILAPEHLPDDRRFESLYRRYRGALLGYCRHCVAGAAAAEDVVQETFLRAYRYFGSLDPHRSPWPWLKTIARNVIRDRAARDAKETVADLVELAEAGGEDAAEVAIALDGALTSLRPRHRRALELRYVAGLDPQRAAEILGISVPALNQLVARARARLKSELRRLGQGVPGVGLLPRLRQRLARLWARTGAEGAAVLSRAPTEVLFQVGAGIVAILLVAGLPGGRAAQAASEAVAPPALVAIESREVASPRRLVAEGPPIVPPAAATVPAAAHGPRGKPAGGSEGGGVSGQAPSTAPDVGHTLGEVVDDVQEAAPKKSRPIVKLAPGLPVDPPPCPVESCEAVEPPEDVPALPVPDVPELPVDPTKKIRL